MKRSRHAAVEAFLTVCRKRPIAGTYDADAVYAAEMEERLGPLLSRLKRRDR